MFLIDKYTPKDVSDAIFHTKLINRLTVMSKDDSIPHLIFYGHEGVGKKTIIRLLLEKIYDKDINKLIDSTYIVTGSGNVASDVITKQSNYHIVIEPNSTNFDRYLIQDVVKEYAKLIPLDVFKTRKIFKTVGINNMDKLSYYAQMSLRRTMEKYSTTCRFIMWCTSQSKIIDPLRSRCVCIRVPSPTKRELIEWILMVSFKESYPITLRELAYIIDNSNNNIKTATWILEILMIGGNPQSTYNNAIGCIAKLIMKKEIRGILKIRDIDYNILITNISGGNIIRDITTFLCSQKSISNIDKFRIIEMASKYDHNFARGRRDTMHLEAFMCHVISILRRQSRITQI